MRKFFMFMGLLLALSLSASCSAQKNDHKKNARTESSQVSAQPASQAESSGFSQINLSFLQTARSALLKSIPKRTGYYTLTMYNISPYLTYYSQRPRRMTGLVPIENFVKAWSVGENSFQESNPNGVIVAGFIDGVANKGNSFYLVSISVPRYDLKKRIMQYTVRAVGMKKFVLDHIKFDNVMLAIN